jgi:hypothetical protein
MILAKPVKNILRFVFHFTKKTPMELSEIESVKFFFEQLRPVDNGFDLIRIGGDNDGGYLIPSDLSGISTLVSPGCDQKIDFEVEIHQTYKIPSVVLDKLEKKPENCPEFITYIPKWLGIHEDSSNEILETVVEKFNKSEEFMLQMDIEGMEYQILLSLKESLVKRFRIMVIELHDLELLLCKPALEKFISPALEIILRTHDVVHLHANNAGGKFYHGAMAFPRIVEITLHRKDRSLGSKGFRNIPNLLDMKNIESIDDISINMRKLSS